MLQEFLLEDVQPIWRGQALDRLDGFALSLHPQHETRAKRAAIDDHGAGTAVSSQAPFLAAGQLEYIPQNLEQALARLTQELNRFTVDICFDYDFFSHFGCRGTPLIRGMWITVCPTSTQRLVCAARARSIAFAKTRRVKTPVTCRRNSAVPRISSIGEVAAIAS